MLTGRIEDSVSGSKEIAINSSSSSSSSTGARRMPCEEATEVETHHQQTAATTMGVAEDDTPSSLSSHPNLNSNNPSQEDYLNSGILEEDEVRLEVAAGSTQSGKKQKMRKAFRYFQP
ncbi:hypothetical protein M0802_011290 [Mischocyttarus mexicanus]|nr:hypothetical protein M0802_011290 [Mischocyttarus mexicanus]